MGAQGSDVKPSGPMPLILASASPRRKALLAQIGVTPSQIIPADIDETPAHAELPRPHALRLAEQKAISIVQSHKDAFVLAADTVVGVGRRILPKTESVDEARRCITLMSGRAHRVYTGVCLIAPDGGKSVKVSETRVKVKRLSAREIDSYLESKEWDGKAGGYAIQGQFEAHIISIAGSYSGVVGLPLFETRNMLTGLGYMS